MDYAVVRLIGERLRRCKSVLFITGAGLSAESGLRTYRGSGGLYERGVTEEGVPIEAALSGAMLLQRPELPWRHLSQIEGASRDAKPNRGHHRIAEAESVFPRVWTLTQNVDGLHRAAGSQNLIEIHGNVHDIVCTRCNKRSRVSNYSVFDSIPPVCAVCGGVLRPEVVLFGEALPQLAVRELTFQLHQGFDAVFSIGTTSVFPYIAEPVRIVRGRGGLTVEINPGETEVSDDVEFRLQMGAGDTLDAIFAELDCVQKEVNA